MRFPDLLAMSVNSLRRRKLRTALTVLGVIVGTASIVVMMSLGIGMSEMQMELMESYGSMTAINVYCDTYSQPQGGADPIYLTDEVVEQIRHMEHVDGISPLLSVGVMMRQGQYTASYVNLVGVTEDYMEQIPVGEGTYPKMDGSQVEMLFGNMVLVDFYEKGTGSGYWETGELPDIDLSKDKLFVILDQDSYYQTQETADLGAAPADSEGSGGRNTVKTPKKYVLGVCGVIAGGPDAYNANSYNVLCDIYKLREYLQKEFRGRAIPGQPTTQNGKPYGQFVYSSASLQADDMDHVEELAQTIRSMGYDVYTNVEYINGMKKTLGMVQAVLGGIGAVSLLVAAIGIANTMMMAIYERTKEIGVMKVIGCSLKNIRQLFLLEAAFIGLIGGIAGNVLSLIISGVINILISGESLWGTEGNISYIPVWLMLASMGFAVLVGMAAGYFPAVRAMKLSPLAAIRNE